MIKLLAIYLLILLSLIGCQQKHETPKLDFLVLPKSKFDDCNSTDWKCDPFKEDCISKMTKCFQSEKDLLTCPAPKIVNKTTTWTDRDQQTLERAKKRCGTLYADAPCLKLFEKYEERSYHAICGESK